MSLYPFTVSYATIDDINRKQRGKMNKKTRKLVARIENASGGKVVFSDSSGLEVSAALESLEGTELLSAYGCRNRCRAAKALLREVRRRGRAMAKA